MAAMLRTRTGLSRPVLKWVSQVAASLGATLAATAIWSAVPHPGSAPRPELTSGGKFAARAVEAVAYDGLDAMPLPRVAAAPPAASAPPAPTLIRAAWESAPAFVPAPERPARATRTAHASARAEAHRAPSAEPQPRPIAFAAEAADPAPSAEASPPEHGVFASVLPAVAATARAAWDTTASAGGALVARVVPQVP